MPYLWRDMRRLPKITYWWQSGLCSILVGRQPIVRQSWPPVFDASQLRGCYSGGVVWNYSVDGGTIYSVDTLLLSVADQVIKSKHQIFLSEQQECFHLKPQRISLGRYEDLAWVVFPVDSITESRVTRISKFDERTSLGDIFQNGLSSSILQNIWLIINYQSQSILQVYCCHRPQHQSSVFTAIQLCANLKIISTKIISSVVRSGVAPSRVDSWWQIICMGCYN